MERVEIFVQFNDEWSESPVFELDADQYDKVILQRVEYLAPGISRRVIRQTDL